MQVLQKLFYYSVFIILAVFMASCCEADNKSNRLQAPEFPAQLPWLNVSEPITIGKLKGKVIILDFWTYGCINCMHVIPDLEKLEEKYGNQIAVIGVHSPKFENEKNLNTLRNIVIRYDLKHPVINDVDFILWKQYGVQAWPTFVVIDPAGSIVGSLAGEGHYNKLDQTIAILLDQHHDQLNTKPLPIALEKEALSESLLSAPGKIAVSDQYVAISDSLHHRIILASHNGKAQYIIGGIGRGFQDGDKLEARFNNPQGLAFSANGLYVADTGNHVIRYIDFATMNTTTVAGNGNNEFHPQGSYHATTIGLRSPWALALQKDILYIAMAGSHQIWQVDIRKNLISTLAGSSREQLTDGQLLTAGFNQPSGLSVQNQWLYVADAEASAIRRIDLNDKQVDTLIGKGLFDFGDRDGDFDQVQLQHVLGIGIVDNQTIIIADTYNHRLKQLNLKARQVNSLVGIGQPSADRNNGLNEPGGLFVYKQQVFIADTGNNRIMVYDQETKKLSLWPLQMVD